MTRRPESVLSRLLPVVFVAFSCATAGAQPAGSPDAGASGSGSPPIALSGTFVWLSDIHLTPFYPYSWKYKVDQTRITAMLEKLVDRSDPAAPKWKSHDQWGAVFSSSPLQADAFSTRGHDSNDKVLQAVLEHAAAVAPKPDFVLITGDLLGHGFGYDYSELVPSDMNNGAAYRTFVAETIKYIALSVRTNFPDPPVIATLGNNDADCGDYDLHLENPPADFLGDTADTFLQYFLPNLQGAAKQAFLTTFAQGGYYTAPVPNGGGSRILVLNSVPFMAVYPDDNADGSFPDQKARKLCDNSPVVDAQKQLQWLATEAAKPGRAWIAAHVPPGIACYDDSVFWTADHLTTFRDLFLGGGSAGNLAGTLSAHSHMASFKLLRDASDQAVSFVVQAPSISPNHSNNPTFGVVTHDPGTLEIESHRIYYLDLSRTGTNWGHFQFAGLTGPTTAPALDSLYSDLGTNAAIWNMFAGDYGSRAGAAVSLGNLAQDHLECLDDLTGLQPLAPPG